MHNWAMPFRLSNCAPNCSQTNETPHWVNFPAFHHQIRKDLPGGFHDSGFASFGRSLYSWLGVSTDEAMIRNLSLTLKDFAECAAKLIPAQQKSLDSSAKVVLDFLLAEQGGICAMATTTHCT